MTIKITKNELQKALAIIAPYITKSAISIRISEEGCLEIFSSDNIEGGSVLASINIGGKISHHDWIMVNGQALREMVALADEGVVEIGFTASAMYLKFPCFRAEFRIARYGVSPDAVKFGKTSSSITGKELALISAMTEAASSDEDRPSLHGVYLAANGKNLEAAAADGFILSFASLKSKCEAEGAIYSAKAFNRTKRALSAAEDEDIAIGFHSAGIVLTITRGQTDVTIEIPKMSGKFPDYKQIVKGTTKAVTVQLETKDFNAMLKRATAIGGEIILQVINGRLWSLIHNETEENKSLDSVPVDVDGESPIMCYQTSVLKDVIKACASNGHVKITFPKAEKSPMFFEGEAAVIAMPLATTFKESPFKNLQPSLL